MTTVARQIVYCVFCAVTIVVAVLALTAPARAQTGSVAGAEISASEIDQRMLLNRMIGQAHARGDVIEQLRQEKRTIDEALQRSVTISDAAVESAYARLAGRLGLSAEQMTAELGRAGIRPYTLKHRLRAELAAQRIKP